MTKAPAPLAGWDVLPGPLANASVSLSSTTAGGIVSVSVRFRSDRLAAIPGVGASIRKGLKEPLKKSAKKLRW